MSKQANATKEAFNTSENFADLFEESIQSEKQEGSIVKGRLIAIENDLAVIDVGLKSEGRIPLKEFAEGEEKADLKIGEEIEVYLERFEGGNGQAVISREKALRQKAWDDLENSYNEGDRVNGSIFGRVKGGFTVDVNGVVAFLPGSQVDIRPVKDITPLMNIKQPFQILKMDTKQGNMVVSRRAILEEAREGERNEMLANVYEGAVFEGIVKNITDYGAFVDLGSVDGLLHVTDISWKRISHPSEVLSLGQKINVKVIKFNEDTKRISLGMKQLDGNPWAGIEEKFPQGSRVKGKVTNIADYGVFVEIASGIEGLVHVSEISWTKGNEHPSKRLSLGQEVEVMVLEVDPEKHRISLGIKQCEANPWKEFEEKYPVGTVLEGEVKNLVDFGLFVGFDNAVDGLVHVSDLAWTDRPENELKDYKVGDKVKVKVLSIDIAKERISLGVKQLSEDPRQSLFEGLKKGNTVTCVVSNVTSDGIEVTINGELKTFIKRNDLARDRVDQRPERFAVGDKVDTKIVSVDSKNSSIAVSIKALEVDEQKKAIEEYGSTDSGASLGDILGAALNSSNNEKNNGDKA